MSCDCWLTNWGMHLMVSGNNVKCHISGGETKIWVRQNTKVIDVIKQMSRLGQGTSVEYK